MKKNRLFILALAIVTTMPASAQFATTPAMDQGSQIKQQNNSLPGKIFLSYESPNFKPIDSENYYNIGFNGFGFGYIYSQPLTEIGCSIDFGAKLNFAWSTLEDSEGSYERNDTDGSTIYADNYVYKSSLSYISLTTPISISYNIAMSDKLNIVPYAGINMRIGLGGNYSYYDSDYSYSSYTDETIDDPVVIDEKTSLFSGTSSIKRFTVGYQVGVDIEFKKFFIGFCYSQDFMKLDVDSRYNNTSIRTGVKF